MNLNRLKFNNKGILLFFTGLAIIVLLFAVVNIKERLNKNDILNFRVIYLNEKKEIYSEDPRYCMFLEMYFDSFTFDNTNTLTKMEKETLLEDCTIRVEVSCKNDRNYIVYLDTINRNNYDNGMEFLKREPAIWVVSHVEDNIFVMPGNHGAKLAEVFGEISVDK